MKELRPCLVMSLYKISWRNIKISKIIIRILLSFVFITSITSSGCGLISTSVNPSNLDVEGEEKIPMKVALSVVYGDPLVSEYRETRKDSPIVEINKEIFSSVVLVQSPRDVQFEGAKAFVDIRAEWNPQWVCLIWMIPTLTIIPGFGYWEVDYSLYSLDNDLLYSEHIEKSFPRSLWWPTCASPQSEFVSIFSEIAPDLIGNSKIKHYAEDEYAGLISERFGGGKVIPDTISNGSEAEQEEVIIDEYQMYPPYNGNKILIAVLELGATMGDQGSAPGFTDILRSELLRTGRFRIVSREEMKTILGDKEFQQSGGCDNTECIVELGKILGVEKIVGGNIMKVGRIYSLTLKLFDVETAELEWSDYVKRTGTNEELFSMINALVNKMILIK